MATLGELSAFNKKLTEANRLTMPKVQNKKEKITIPKLAEESPLNVVERLGWATMRSPEAKKEFLQQRFEDKDILDPTSSPTGDWAILTSEGSVFPIDPKGFGKGGLKEAAGDIAESVPDIAAGIATGAGQSLGAVGGALAMPFTAGVVNPVTGEMAAGGAAGTASELALQKLGRMATGVKAPISGKDVAIAGGTGMIPLSAISKKLFPGKIAAKGIENLIDAGAPEEVIKKAPKLLQKSQGKNTLSNLVNENLGLKNSAIAKDLIEGKIDMKNIMKGTGDEKIINSAKNISETLTKGRGVIGAQMDNDLIKGLSKQANRPVTIEEVNAIKIPATNTRETISKLIKDLKVAPIKSDSTKSILADLKSWQKNIGKNKKYTYGELKKITKTIYDQKSTAITNGDSAASSVLRKLDAAMRKDKNLNSVIRGANEKYSKAARLLDGLENTIGSKIKPLEGEMADSLMTGSRPLPMKLKRLTSEYRSPQLQVLERIENELKKQRGFENITYIKDLKEGLLNEVLDKSSKKGIPFIPYSEKIPFVKEVLSPHTKAKGFYSGLTKGTNLADAPISSTMPTVSGMLPMSKAIIGSKIATPFNTKVASRMAIAAMIQRLTKPR